jgi:hypothetical protein
MPLDLYNRLKNAKIKKISNSTSEVIRLIVSTISKDTLNDISGNYTTNSGRGGNTNFGENMAIKPFIKIPNTINHPNGLQKPPDILLAGKYKVELKSIRNINGKFAFNDSIPDPLTYYCFYARKEKRMLSLRGDILLIALNSDRIIKLNLKIQEARKIGRTTKKDGLEYYYPRQNLFIRSFLNAVEVNGYFDFDNNTIWVPND